MIPTHIHQVWVGPLDPPWEWISTWREKNPNFEHTLWTEDVIEQNLAMKNQSIYDYYMSRGCYNGASDILRYEILASFGGIYLDADSICVHTLEDAPFMNSDFFASFSPNLPDRVSSGWIGVVPQHPILQDCLKELSELTEFEPPWNTVGGTLLTRVLRNYPESLILPSKTFYGVKTHDQTEIQSDAKQYGLHFGGTTRQVYTSGKSDDQGTE